jgi:predicted RND superfamily exporter protein
LPSFLLDADVNEMLGYSQSPVVVLTDTIEEERLVATAMRKRQEKSGDATTVDFVLATTDLIPDNQVAKRVLIEKLNRIVDKIKPSWLDPSQRQHLALARRMTRAEPFGRQDLPPEVRRQFQGQSSSPDHGFVLAFPAIDITIGSEVSRFAKEVRGVPLPDGRRVSAAGEDMILADIFDMVTSEAPPVLSLTLVLVLVTLVLLLGSVRLAALCLTPAVITLAVTLGLMPWVGLELNYLNIVMIPVLFGIGVDGGAHIVTRLHAGQELRFVVTETGRAIAGAILTTGLGFGALMIADHPGLESLGSLAVLGLAVNALASLVVLPAFLALRPRRAAEEIGAAES